MNEWLFIQEKVAGMMSAAMLMSILPVNLTAYAGTSRGEAAKYQAEVNLGAGGSLSLMKSSDLEQSWNTAEEELIPRKTVILGTDGRVQTADVTAEARLSSALEGVGAQGVRLGRDITGVKSYFTLPNEIVCLGAGLEKGAGVAGDIVTVVDNVPVNNKTCASLTTPNSGLRYIRKAALKEWTDVVDHATQGNHKRKWLFASESTKDIEWAYIFGDSISNSKVYYRFNTMGSGIPALFESWVQPTSKKDYVYTMIPARLKTDFDGITTYPTDSEVLVNTQDTQAVYGGINDIVALNQWKEKDTVVSNDIGDITLCQLVFLVMHLEDTAGRLSLSVAKPEDQTTGEIELVIAAGGKKLLSVSDEKALAEQSVGDTIRLKFDASMMENGPVTVVIETSQPIDAGDCTELTLVCGDRVTLPQPEGFTAPVTWSSLFLKDDGSTVNNAGNSKIKRELVGNETDGGRTAGPASAAHLTSVTGLRPGQGGSYGTIEKLTVRIEEQTGKLSFVITDPGCMIITSLLTEGEAVNKADLEKAIESAEKRVELQYTADSWKRFTDALDAAKEVLADPAATQEEVDKAVKMLKDKEALLEKIPETRPDKRENSGNFGSVYTVSDKNWSYVDQFGWIYTQNGRQLKDQWAYLPWRGISKWYYFDETGLMKTGWFTWNGDWYYLYPVADGNAGQMLTGWQQIDGTWYFFQEASDGKMGALYRSTETPDGYQVDENGVWKN